MRHKVVEKPTLHEKKKGAKQHNELESGIWGPLGVEGGWWKNESWRLREEDFREREKVSRQRDPVYRTCSALQSHVLGGADFHPFSVTFQGYGMYTHTYNLYSVLYKRVEKLNSSGVKCKNTNFYTHNMWIVFQRILDTDVYNSVYLTLRLFLFD